MTKVEITAVTTMTVTAIPASMKAANRWVRSGTSITSGTANGGHASHEETHRVVIRGHGVDETQQQHRGDDEPCGAAEEAAQRRPGSALAPAPAIGVVRSLCSAGAACAPRLNCCG